MKLYSAIVNIIYLIVLAMSAGGVFVLGVFVAPVVFNADTLFNLSQIGRFEEGLIMAEIFRRFTFWLYVAGLFIVVYEVYLFKIMQRDKVASLSAFTSVFAIAMFNGVYTPKILELQTQGASVMETPAFESLHKASELDFKILLVALLVLVFRRIMLLKKMA